MTVSGHSMGGIIRDGDQILVRPVDPEEIQIGDIVVFGSASNMGCHRVVGKIRLFGLTIFLQKGDSSEAGGVFLANELVGKVTIDAPPADWVPYKESAIVYIYALPRKKDFDFPTKMARRIFDPTKKT